MKLLMSLLSLLMSFNVYAQNIHVVTGRIDKETVKSVCDDVMLFELVNSDERYYCFEGSKILNFKKVQKFACVQFHVPEPFLSCDFSVSGLLAFAEVNLVKDNFDVSRADLTVLNLHDYDTTYESAIDVKTGSESVGYYGMYIGDEDFQEFKFNDRFYYAFVSESGKYFYYSRENQLVAKFGCRSHFYLGGLDDPIFYDRNLGVYISYEFYFVSAKLEDNCIVRAF